MRSGVVFLLVFVLTRDLSNSNCLTPLDNLEVNSSGLAVGQEGTFFLCWSEAAREKENF